MKYEYKQKLDDVLSELEIIRDWINKDRNKFDVKTKYLISYAVVKASGTIETVFKQIIFDFLVFNARQETSKYLEKMIYFKIYLRKKEIYLIKKLRNQIKRIN